MRVRAGACGCVRVYLCVCARVCPVFGRRASRRSKGDGLEGLKTLLDAGADVTYFSVMELYYRAPRFLAVSAKNKK